MRGKKLCQFWLLTWKTFIGQFVHIVGFDWLMGVGEGIMILARCAFHFIIKHENWCNIRVLIYLFIFKDYFMKFSLLFMLSFFCLEKVYSIIFLLKLNISDTMKIGKKC